MLESARICADVPTADLERARRFYEGALGLKVLKADTQRSVYYKAGGGTMLNLYERPHHPAAFAVATFLVDDIEQSMSDLRKARIVFEDYDEPDLKTHDGVFSDATGFKVCWFKDPDGNILSLEQLPGA